MKKLSPEEQWVEIYGFKTVRDLISALEKLPGGSSILTTKCDSDGIVFSQSGITLHSSELLVKISDNGRVCLCIHCGPDEANPHMSRKVPLFEYVRDL